jgi:hypothetical protein
VKANSPFEAMMKNHAAGEMEIALDASPLPQPVKPAMLPEDVIVLSESGFAGNNRWRGKAAYVGIASTAFLVSCPRPTDLSRISDPECGFKGMDRSRQTVRLITEPRVPTARR